MTAGIVPGAVRIAAQPLGGGEFALTRAANGKAGPAPFNLADPDVVRDPFPVYAQLRELAPVLRSDALFGGAWVVLDHDDVTALFRDHERLSNAKASGIVDDLPAQQRAEFAKLVELHSRWMVFFDAPRHTRLRKLMARGFVPSVRERLVASAREHVDLLLAGLEGRRQFDLIADFASTIPLAAMVRLLDVPAAHVPLFSRWTDDIGAYMGSERADPALMRRAQDSLIAFEEHFRDVIAERRRRPQAGDLLSLLIAAEEEGEVLTTDELFAQCSFIGFTGNETTKNLIGNALYRFLANPAQQPQAGDQTALRAALEEVLRLDTPVQFVSRIVKETFAWNGVTLRRGEYVIFMLGAANRDPKHFTNPNAFEPGRGGIPHVAFGEGAHACLGQALARLEAEVAVSAFLARYPHATIDDAAWHRNPGLRGLERATVSC